VVSGQFDGMLREGAAPWQNDRMKRHQAFAGATTWLPSFWHRC
jgi:hypothetical protein